uniref:Uncharacterized protein n=1 Tax=Chromera velia CCMP2878 TaxID=1169474 RepID=A0A0G4H1A1_9ALVE|eukprot:Cvel_24248.t1-p1 / transcript=Cvel_24248.t1 / gene=Cvel_24248 / organism=Chromera_velia_CCMP2878 / gene_product=hypothetical protein / transcript_product=hypothetical protein / location=Cvel_scaffold2597:16289-18831(-) / protein_length=76 / sequence_SO=supercontig / SO=protein_coding / is_pseudo=false
MVMIKWAGVQRGQCCTSAQGCMNPCYIFCMARWTDTKNGTFQAKECCLAPAARAVNSYVRPYARPVPYTHIPSFEY